MVDQEMLKAVSELLDKKLAVHKDEVVSSVKIMMENEFRADLKALAEGQKGIVEDIVDIKKQLAANVDLQDEMSVVKAAIKTHTAQIKANTAEIDKLKKAQ